MKPFGPKALILKNIKITIPSSVDRTPFFFLKLSRGELVNSNLITKTSKRSVFTIVVIIDLFVYALHTILLHTIVHVIANF